MSSRTGQRVHLVRPRWVWSGLVLALLGAGCFALWTATWHAGFGIAGVVLLVLGGAVAWRGGILYDTHGGGRPLVQEYDDLHDENVHDGTAPGDMVRDERLREEARETTQMTQELIRATDAAPRPPFDTLGAGLLLAAAVVLVLAQGFYPHTHTGQDNALRSLLIAAVIALAALRLLLGQRPGRTPSVIAGLCGLALILFAFLTDHDRQGTVALEIVVGAWVLVMAMLSLDHAEPEPTPEAVPDVRPKRVQGRSPDRGRRADDARIAAVAVTIAAAVLGLFRLRRRATGRDRHASNVE